MKAPSAAIPNKLIVVTTLPPVFGNTGGAVTPKTGGVVTSQLQSLSSWQTGFLQNPW